MFKKTLLLFITSVTVWSVVAQRLTPTVVASGGGSATKSSYSLAYTVGETNIITLKSQNYVVTQGFHQTKYQLGSNPIITPLTASPNPVTSRCSYKLRLTFYITEEVKAYTVTICNLSGRIVGLANYDNLLVNDFKIIDFSDYALGMYLVKVQSKNGKIVRTFKIEKL